MKKLFLVLALALILINSTEVFANSSKFGFLADNPQNQKSLRVFYAQSQISVDTTSSKYLQNKNLRLKDPAMALFYSVIPGLVVHGSGHFYAGKRKTGFLLLGIELLSFAILVDAAMLDWAESETGAKQWIDPGVPYVIGTVLFWGSWLYDLFRSPVEVKKRNEELLRSGNIDIEFEIKESLYCLKLAKKF
jgi:hypothetical protein